MAKEPDNTRGKSAVVVSIADAARDLARQRRRRDDPPPNEKRGDAFAGKWTANSLGLPRESECPVIPLGIEAGAYHFIDSNWQHRKFRAADLSHAGIQDLFACTPNYPMWMCPHYGKKKTVTVKVGDEEIEKETVPIESFKLHQVAQILMRACSLRGTFSAKDKLRGLGAWKGKGGALILHCGEELWQWDDGKSRPVPLDVGLHEGFLYPRMPSLPPPWTEAVKPADNPAGPLLTAYRAMHWERPDVDPVLLLGHNGISLIGGALDWRSAVLLLGGFGVGKSFVQDLLKVLFEAWLCHTANTSAAGIYQDMAHDTRPVAVDELEPDANPARVDELVRLMRQASSGAIARRGSAGHEAVQFELRNAFLFSAINNPLHDPQDLSRVAILRLRELDRTKKPPPINLDTCGRKLLHVLMREWHRFEKTRELYMGALGAGGHSARGQKQYGTLLAVADMILGPELGEELGIPTAFDCDGRENSTGLAWWGEVLSAEALPEIEDALPNWKRCVRWLFTNPVEPWRGGGRPSVGQRLDDMMTWQRNALKPEDVKYTVSECKRDLADAGLGLKTVEEVIASKARAQDCGMEQAARLLGLVDQDGRPDGGYVVAVPNEHPATKKLFRDSAWASGVWKDALRQCEVPGLVLTDRDVNRVSIGIEQTRCTLIVVSRYQQAPER